MTPIATAPITESEPITQSRAKTEWRAVVARYQGSDVSRSIVQMITTLVPLAAMLLSDVPVARAAVLDNAPARLPGGRLARAHVHHHARLRPRLVPPVAARERVVGWITGVLTLTPFGAVASRSRAASRVVRRSRSPRTWRRRHDHGARVSRAQSRGARFKYRLIRNPFVLFGIGPIHFMIDNRIPPLGVDATRQRDRSVWWTKLAIVVLIVGRDRVDRVAAVLLDLFPAMYIAAAAGIWLFYVQHQFEDAYWKDHGEWDYATSAIRGSSYFKLPAVLQWFTGNIGLHHVHHLGPRIPNYKLERCHDENPLFHEVTVLTLRRALATMRLALWDEDTSAPRRLLRYSAPVEIASLTGKSDVIA